MKFGQGSPKVENNEWRILSASALSAASGARFAPSTAGSETISFASACSIADSWLLQVKRRSRGKLGMTKGERLAQIQESEARTEIRYFREGRLQ